MESTDNSGKVWTSDEIDLIIADYFNMLHMELRGEPFVKSQRNASLQNLINRSRGSIEFKHQNISAVLEVLGVPRIRGYRPAMNFQNALLDGVERFLDQKAQVVAELPMVNYGFSEETEIFLEKAPQKIERPEESNQALTRLVRKFDPAARDERNRKLGRMGEERVLKSEYSKLVAEGRPDLARKIKWVSDIEGDGAGYDILSFSAEGQERFLEVKTTSGNSLTPFYVSRNEKRFSEERPDGFRIFRLYDFASQPKAFEIAPPLETSLILDPANYQATFR